MGSCKIQCSYDLSASSSSSSSRTVLVAIHSLMRSFLRSLSTVVSTPKRVSVPNSLFLSVKDEWKLSIETFVAKSSSSAGRSGSLESHLSSKYFSSSPLRLWPIRLSGFTSSNFRNRRRPFFERILNGFGVRTIQFLDQRSKFSNLGSD